MSSVKLSLLVVSSFRVLGRLFLGKHALNTSSYLSTLFLECFFWKPQVSAYGYVREPAPLCQT